MYNVFLNLINNLDIPKWLSISLFSLSVFIIITSVVLFTVLLLVLFERKLLAAYTQRYGPNRVGKWGILQTTADAFKLLIKENAMPNCADKKLFFAAPIIAFCPAVTIYALLPYNEYFTPVNINTNAVLFAALAAVPLIGVFLAGYSSKNKFALLGSIRAVCAALSYEIPLTLCLLSVFIYNETLNINTIVQSQNTGYGIFGWNFIPLIVAFITFFIAMLMEMNRAPFDISEAESELVSGYNTEYSGMKFAMFYMGEYALFFIMTLFFVSCFLGGYLSPFGIYILPKPYYLIEQTFWLLLKAFIVMSIIILIRVYTPRLRYDRILEFSYKILIPLSLINLCICLVICALRGLV